MTTNKDFNLNIEYLKQEFLKECTIVAADPDFLTRGIIYRRTRQGWLGDILLATGHTINYKTGKAEYTRK